MKRLKDKVALITGGAAGIGLETARLFLSEGAKVALVDLRESDLSDTARDLGNSGDVLTIAADVSSVEDCERYVAQTVEKFGRIDVFFNNAGVALGSTVEAMTWEDMDWLMGINFWGVVHGTKAFLPHLIRSGEGHVVNVSSVFGLISVPTQSAYNAAKFGVRGFTDALYMELKVARHPVSATTVHPGGIKTNIVKNARLHESLGAAADLESTHGRFQSISMTSPEKAASAILTAVRRDRRRVTVGPDAKVIDLLSRLPAPLYQQALVLGARRELT